MTLVLDTAPLVALADATDPRRDQVLEVLHTEPGGLYVPAPVTAEVDYMLGRRFGPAARRAFLADLAATRCQSVGLTPADYSTCLQLDAGYQDLGLGLADLSVMVVAASIGTRRVMSFDERDFRAVRGPDGEPFTLLPADA